MLRETVTDEGDRTVAGLASSVATCLLTLETPEERAFPHLKEALLHLRTIARSDQPTVFRGCHERRTVETFLSFLLPDIDAASAAAGIAVRQAIVHLRQQARPVARAGARPILN